MWNTNSTRGGAIIRVIDDAKAIYSFGTDTVQLVKCAKVATSIALKIHFPLAWAVKPTLYKQLVFLNYDNYFSPKNGYP